MVLKTKKRPLWIQEIVSFFQFKNSTSKKPISLPENHHDLSELFQEINLKYFSNSLALSIEWNGRGTTRSKTVIRLGCYNQKTEAIRINRLLDQPHIPKSFVSYIIYHEILHHLYPPTREKTGRRRIHHYQFLEKEKEFEEYETAQQFLVDLKKMIFKK